MPDRAPPAAAPASLRDAEVNEIGELIAVGLLSRPNAGGLTAIEAHDIGKHVARALRPRTVAALAASPPALDAARLAEAIHTSNDHGNQPGCLDMDRDSADMLVVEYERLSGAATPASGESAAARSWEPRDDRWVDDEFGPFPPVPDSRGGVVGDKFPLDAGPPAAGVEDRR